MFNYFLSWKQAAKGRSEQNYSSTSSISISVDDVDAIDVWHLLSLSFLLATCAEVSSFFSDHLVHFMHILCNSISNG